jgi:hypothetical protein
VLVLLRRGDVCDALGECKSSSDVSARNASSASSLSLIVVAACLVVFTRALEAVCWREVCGML